MALASGTRIGVYEIVSALGEGAMGEVYRARDTKLHREVAIKVLPDAFATDPERLTRFEREAHVLASLNHPHIAQIHGFEESASGCALVMELVEGSTLGEHMAQRAPMPLDEALHIARQIAEALEAAHERGIVHRDLKPANIKIDADGNVKVLDFGLAKGMDAAMSATSDSMSSPTLTAPGTALGLILGTAAYMAPEQAQGKPVDKRADIWSFGVVLYEMLTARRLFEGQTVTDTLAAVLTSDPEWAPVPERARPLLRRCLERDPKRRLRDIGDARILLEEAQAPARAPRKPNVVWTLAILGIIVAAGLVVALRWPPAVDHPLMRLDVDMGGEAVINPLGAAVLSPDGRRIVFTARGSAGASVLATRLLDQARVTQLSGTEGAEQPFMSPDGAWIGFFAAGKLKKVSVNGGSSVALADARTPRGGTWAPDGSIIAALTNTTGLSRVPATGGPAEPLTRLEPGEPTHRWPQVLPGGQHVLFTGRSTTFNSFEDASIDVVSLATGDRKTVWRGGYFGRFLPTEGAQGYLVFIRDAVLYGVAFAPDRLEVIGTPVPLLENVASDPSSGAGGFDASTNGLFIYRSGSAPRAWPVVWLDGSGKTQPLLAKPALYYSPRLSPDGQRLAVSIDEGKGMDLFVYDWARDTMSRLTFDGSSNADPVWAPDGKHIVFRSQSGSSWILWWIRSDGAGEPHRLVRTDFDFGNLGGQSFSPDGRVFLFADERPQSDLWTVTLDPPDADRPRVSEPEVVARTGAAEKLPAISPDGRWIAYVSNGSGVDEVYVRSFRGGPTGKWVLSSGGGIHPLWSRKAPELFFETSDGRLMVTTVTTRGESFAVTKPRPWSEFRLLSPGFTNLDLAPDGNRFVILPRSPDATPDAYRMTLVVNFFDEIRRRIPSGR